MRWRIPMCKSQNQNKPDLYLSSPAALSKGLATLFFTHYHNQHYQTLDDHYVCTSYYFASSLTGA